MKRLIFSMLMGVVFSAAATVIHAAPIISVVDPSLCMAVKGVVSEGANVQLQKCSDLGPVAPDIHGDWKNIAGKICQLNTADWYYYCIDYDGPPPNAGDSKDAKVTKWAGWKANQNWNYGLDNKFRGHSGQCLDVNALETDGPGQIKVSACEAWKTHQLWSF